MYDLRTPKWREVLVTVRLFGGGTFHRGTGNLLRLSVDCIYRDIHNAVHED